MVLSYMDPSMRWCLRRMCPTLTNSAGWASLPFLTLPLCLCCWHYCTQFDVPCLRPSFEPHLDPRSCPLPSFCFLLTTEPSLCVDMPMEAEPTSRAQAFLKSGTRLGGLIARGTQVGPLPVTTQQRVMGKREERHFPSFLIP